MSLGCAQWGIRYVYDVGMTNTQEHTTYRGVTIFALRNARNGGNKIQIRDIAVTYTPDRWSDVTADATRATTSLARAHAHIDWLLANGATVSNGRIVTTIGTFEICESGCNVQGIEGSWIFLKDVK